MLSRAKTFGTRLGTTIGRPISTEARAALDLAHQRRMAALQAEANIAAAKAKANQATINAYRKKQEALREVAKSKLEAESILEQEAAYSKQRNTGTGAGTGASAGFDASNAVLLAGGLVAIGLVITKITEDKAKKEAESVKPDLEVYKAKGAEGLKQLDSEIYDKLNALQGVGFEAKLLPEIRDKVIIFRECLSTIPVSGKGINNPTIVSDAVNARVETVADALLIMEAYRIAIGAIESGWIYGKSNVKAGLGGKNFYDLVKKFMHALNYVRNPNAALKAQGPIKKELQGGRRRTRRRRTHRRSKRRSHSRH